MTSIFFSLPNLMLGRNARKRFTGAITLKSSSSSNAARSLENALSAQSCFFLAEALSLAGRRQNLQFVKSSQRLVADASVADEVVQALGD
jgi:hypothetical protein